MFVDQSSLEPAELVRGRMIRNLQEDLLFVFLPLVGEADAAVSCTSFRVLCLRSLLLLLAARVHA